MARVEVAGVFAHLGFEVETSGAKRFEAEIEKARALSKRPIEQKVDVDDASARVKLAAG
jgi:NOL1/NOP2/fmu family ribosome biogenesis protein